MSLDTPRILWQPGDDIASILHRHASETPSRVALAQGDRSLTWAELDARVDRVASALFAAGSRPGDKVALLGNNSIEYVEIVFGALRAGACVVPLPTMASTEALARMVVDSGSWALFVAEAYRDVGDAIAGPRVELGVGLDFETSRFREYEAFGASGSAPRPPVRIGPDDAFDVI